MALKEILKANGIRGLLKLNSSNYLFFHNQKLGLYSGLNLAIIGASSAWGIYIFV